MLLNLNSQMAKIKICVGSVETKFKFQADKKFFLQMNVLFVIRLCIAALTASFIRLALITTAAKLWKML